MKHRILIVEDEPDLARILQDYLLCDGFEAKVVDNGLLAIAATYQWQPDLLLLDLMLPGRNGLSILQELRQTSALPVIMITARVDEVDRLIGLEAGADDYVCKPFSPREVVARVKVVLRRAASSAMRRTIPEHLPQKITVDATLWTAQVGHQKLNLTPKEFKLLQALSQRPGRVLSRAQLLDAIGEDTLDVSERAVDSHMKNLRKKLVAVFPQCEPIRSVYGVGFVLDLP
jgi:two-component system, OmpR family, response regulator BaeR